MSFAPTAPFSASRTLHRCSGVMRIADGRICVTLSGPAPPNFCLQVLKDKAQYLFRYRGRACSEPAAAATSGHAVSAAE